VFASSRNQNVAHGQARAQRGSKGLCSRELCDRKTDTSCLS